MLNLSLTVRLMLDNRFLGQLMFPIQRQIEVLATVVRKHPLQIVGNALNTSGVRENHGRLSVGIRSYERRSLHDAIQRTEDIVHGDSVREFARLDKVFLSD